MSKKVITIDVLDKTPISDILSFSTEELFALQEQSINEFEKAKYRKKWVEGIIELKYKTTINSFYEQAKKYFELEASDELEKFREEFLVHYIQADKDNIIRVEFYQDISEISGEIRIGKKFRLIKKVEVK